MPFPLVEALVSKFLDADEKVRAAVCKLYGQLDYETALHHVDIKHLKVMTERMIDKKVRRARSSVASITHRPSSIRSEWKHSQPSGNSIDSPIQKCKKRFLVMVTPRTANLP